MVYFHSNLPLYGHYAGLEVIPYTLNLLLEMHGRWRGAGRGRLFAIALAILQSVS